MISHYKALKENLDPRDAAKDDSMSLTRLVISIGISLSSCETE
jgi:hypothetical protein